MLVGALIAPVRGDFPPLPLISSPCLLSLPQCLSNKIHWPTVANLSPTPSNQFVHLLNSASKKPAPFERAAHLGLNPTVCNF